MGASASSASRPVAAATIAPRRPRAATASTTRPASDSSVAVTIVNTFTTSGSRARVTVRECHGAAGDPTAACTTDVQTLNRAVTRVTQCNASTNGGGGTLRCSVDVTNRFVGIRDQQVDRRPSTSASVPVTASPTPAIRSRRASTGAAITQCNGSANGGTLVGLTCTATGHARSRAIAVTINQCNGSTNGGGALVICSVRMSQHVHRDRWDHGSRWIGHGGRPPAPPDEHDRRDRSRPRVAATPLALLGLLLVFAFTFVVSGLAASPRETSPWTPSDVASDRDLRPGSIHESLPGPVDIDRATFASGGLMASDDLSAPDSMDVSRPRRLPRAHSALAGCGAVSNPTVPPPAYSCEDVPSGACQEQADGLLRSGRGDRSARSRWSAPVGNCTRAGGAGTATITLVDNTDRASGLVIRGRSEPRPEPRLFRAGA